DLRDFYTRIWSAGHLGYEPYEEKAKAINDRASLGRLVSELPRYGWAIDQIRHLPRGSKVLDIGCGEGAVLHAARDLGCDAFGCDLAPGAVALAQRIVTPDHVHLGTVEELPHEPETFDCIVALEVLEHLPSPRQFLDCATGLLKPGGA